MVNKDTQQNDKKEEWCSAEALGSLFEICVKGQLDSSWSDWFEGMEVKLLDNDQMMLCGYIIDQAALMGILNKLCGLNLTLRWVREVRREEKQPETNDKEK
jgi:hypothetical protein